MMMSYSTRFPTKKDVNNVLSARYGEDSAVWSNVLLSLSFRWMCWRYLLVSLVLLYSSLLYLCICLNRCAALAISIIV